MPPRMRCGVRRTAGGAAELSAQAVTYLAAAPKSNASYVALKRFAGWTFYSRSGRANPQAPGDSRSATGRKAAGDEAYLNPHDHPGGYVAQEYLPEGVQTQHVLRMPTEHGAEAEIKSGAQRRNPSGSLRLATSPCGRAHGVERSRRPVVILSQTWERVASLKRAG